MNPINAAFRIVSQNGLGMVLEIEDHGTEDCTGVVMKPQAENLFQKWFRNPDGTIQSLGVQKVLDIENGVDEGNRLIIFQHHGSFNQRFHPTDDGYIHVSDLCIEIENNGQEAGGRIVAGTHNSGIHQKWRFVPCGEHN